MESAKLRKVLPIKGASGLGTFHVNVSTIYCNGLDGVHSLQARDDIYEILFKKIKKRVPCT
jgi:hypothetical protein